MTRRTSFFLPVTWAAVVTLSACVPAGDGVQPIVERSYFPVGLSVDPTGDWLYVVNSDFDLQYNQGTVQSLDLRRIEAVARRPCSRNSECATDGAAVQQRCDTTATPENGGDASFFCVDVEGAFAGLPCGAIPENSASARAVSPGRCGPVNLTDPPGGGAPLQTDAVAISAFATDSLLVRRPVVQGDGTEVPSATQSRLFLPVRGDSSLHFIDVDGGRLQCGQTKLGGSCSADYRVRETETADPEEPFVVPTEPYGIAATSDGRALVMSHQSGGKASAFIHDWSSQRDGKPIPPRLVSVVTNIPTSAIGIATLPPSLVPSDAEGGDPPGFLVTFRNDPSVHLLRFLNPAQALGGAPAAEDRPLLFDVAKAPIAANSVGSDSRGIAIDDRGRRAAGLACNGDQACLALAARVPLDVYVANRSPASLLIGRTNQGEARAAGDLPVFHDNVPLTQGPSRVVLGHVIDPSGQPSPRVFVLCFDSALIYVYDPERRVIETQIQTGRGPHALAFDPDPAQRRVAYVGHFTDSYVGVISLDQRYPPTFGSTLATLGTPSPPRAAK